MAEAGRRVALVAGGSGLVGARLLRVLGDAPEYARVLALSRRPLSFEHPRVANRVTRFEALEQELRGLKCDDAYCCLGTTRRAAGSEAAFRAVDHDLVLAFARLARQAGAQRFVLVSAAGADAGSRFFYLRVKGETEKDLEGLRFASLELLQPALLLGGRRELRPGEALAGLLARLLNPLLIGRLAAWRAVDAGDVAGAMLAVTRRGLRGVRRYASADIVRLARAPAQPRAQL
ncbi:MAG: NAD-dependent epimerase/dehydratase family protein [Gammaproteobacteria bacterium]|nr:NAD-dependent epimerase/dehydratase family protein [Gammaproteobacteria bacterium]